MTVRRLPQLVLIIAVLAATLASTGAVMAWSGCGNYVTVQAGDTLSGIALACDTTAAAIQAANPGLGWQLYPGQVLYIPTGSGSASAPSYYTSYYQAPTVGGTYVVVWGDTLSKIAFRYGVSLSDLLAVNRQIWWPDLIFPGQVISLPGNAVAPPPTHCPPGCSPSSYQYAPYQYAPYQYAPYQYASPPYVTPQYTPTPSVPAFDYSNYRLLTVTYKYGLIVRTGPGRSNPEIQSPLVGAVKDSTWYYNKLTITRDSSGFVWAEIALGNVIDGRTTGWIMVSDYLGNFFTEPNIDH
jgi:LysM repeat protein